MGVGEAYAAMADDIDAIEYNPAGLGLMRWPQLRLWGSWHYVGLNILRNNVAYAHPIPLVGTVAASFTYVSYGLNGVQPILDDKGNYLGKFTPRDTIYTFGWGRHIVHGLHLGWQLKYYEQMIKLKPADAAAAETIMLLGHSHISKAWLGDYGILWKAPVVGFRLAAGIQSTGESVDSYLPPDRPYLGFAYPLGGQFFQRNPMTFSYQLSWPTGSGRVSALGWEFSVARQISFRVGYNLPLGYGYSLKGNRRALEGLRLGFGLGDEYFKLDYAYSYHQQLGNSHFLSTTITFGSDRKEPEEVKEEPEAIGAYIQPGSSPFNLAAKEGNRRVLLSWQPAYAPNVQGFNVYRRMPDGQRKKIVKAPIRKNRCALRGLKNNKEYQFAVSIVFNDFEETFTSFVTATPFSILDKETAGKKFAELVPQEFRVEERGGKLVLRWKNAKDKRITGTYILWKTKAEEDFRRLTAKPIKGRVMALPGKKEKGGKGLISGAYYFIAQNSDGGEGEAEKVSRPSLEVMVKFVAPKDRAAAGTDETATGGTGETASEESEEGEKDKPADEVKDDLDEESTDEI